MAALGYIVLVVSLFSVSMALTPEEKATEEIMRRLKDDYNRTLKPPGHGGTRVDLQFYFRNIDIDDLTMKANFDITFRMLWNDSRLAYGNMPGSSRVQYISLLDPSPLWLPDPFFKNGKITPYKSIHPEQYLRITPRGNIIFSSRLALHQSCPMDLARFPHDTQTCDIKIASYGYTTKDISLQFDSEESKAVTFGMDIHKDRFHFEDYNTDTCNSITSTGEYSCVQVSMKIRREFGTYLIEWYFPCMFLVLVAWFSFLVPISQFLGRLLLTLVPLITLASFSIEYKKSLASVPYFCAIDTFTGISMCVIFLTLLYVILFNAKNDKAEKNNPSSNPEEGEISSNNKVSEEGSGSGGWVRQLAQRMHTRAEYLSRVFLISVYVFFLFVYFVAFCGTG